MLAKCRMQRSLVFRQLNDDFGEREYGHSLEVFMTRLVHLAKMQARGGKNVKVMEASLVIWYQLQQVSVNSPPRPSGKILGLY